MMFVRLQLQHDLFQQVVLTGNVYPLLRDFTKDEVELVYVDLFFQLRLYYFILNLCIQIVLRSLV